ncbi:unnamed protein product [Cuscuta campestris]|uniref:F-box domain-containing protein n=1 Tax=Cuscuta campestris TaxID=132261 RepID=A0A484ND30_9ASTE|nr:unnamed protein product [Cuscuta campestris]
MMGAIENLISAPLSPPNLTPIVTVQNTESHEKEAKDDSNIESHVGNDVGSGLELMNEDNGRSNIVGNNKCDISTHIVSADTLDRPSCECYAPVKALTCVVIDELALLKSVNKVGDADNKQADNHISFDSIKLFDIVDAVKTKHLVSPREPTCGIDSISHVPQFALRSKMLEDSKTGLLLWFSILSPVLKGERAVIEENRYGRSEFKRKTEDVRAQWKVGIQLVCGRRQSTLEGRNSVSFPLEMKKMERMYSLGCKRRRLDNGSVRGFKISIMSGCDKFSPILRLPHEVLREEVLSRLATRDLCRAKCVCKQWHSIISSPDFIKVHRRRNHDPSHGLLIATTDSVNNEFIFYYSPLSEQHHRHQPRVFVPRLRVPRNRDYQWMTQVVNGLVCLYSANRLSLFNICTREILDLPLPPSPSRDALCAAVVDTWWPDTNAVEKDNNLRIPRAGEATNCTATRYYFGFDTLHKVYKILSVSYMCREGCPGPGDLCGCQPFLVPQVLSLSGPVSSFKWRNEVPHPRPFNPLSMHTICVNGRLWWTGNKISRTCFDLTSTPEHFRNITEHPPVSDK